ncbi:MAG: hypothetical protein R2845_06955 [Thermomicrobiales bacterium]
MAVEPLIIELSRPGRRAVRIPAPDVPETDLPAEMLRTDLNWPEVSEIDVIRHYTRISQKNHSIDTGFYPRLLHDEVQLKINEAVARYDGFAGIHPLQPVAQMQGRLSSCSSCRKCWMKFPAMPRTATGRPAHGELTGVLVMRSYHTLRTAIPVRARSSFPTRPLAPIRPTAAMALRRGDDSIRFARQYQHRGAPCRGRSGYRRTDDHQPGTLGLWDENILDAIAAVHEAGGLVYNDGANFNTILGMVQPGDLGVDIIRFNLQDLFDSARRRRPGVPVRSVFAPVSKNTGSNGRAGSRWLLQLVGSGKLHR